MTETEINLNKFAQNLLTDRDILYWFDKFNLSEQKQIRDKLTMFIQQAHPTEAMISAGIKNANIQETMTPVVIFKTHTLKNAINKITNLHDSELRKSFIIMLSIFKSADSFRRENECKNGCSHEWHNLKNQ